MTKFYCEYCGHMANSVQSLTAGTCQRHPLGPYKGKHKLYEGGEKSQYICKYCGHKSSTIASLVAGTFQRHPDGQYKGRHAPAL